MTRIPHDMQGKFIVPLFGNKNPRRANTRVWKALEAASAAAEAGSFLSVESFIRNYNCYASDITYELGRKGIALTHVQVREEYEASHSGDDVLPECFDHVFKLASIRQNVLLTGPSGSGKTWLAAKIAEALDLPFGSLSCTAGVTESQLTGWLLPVGDSGRFAYVPSPFVTAYENGGVYLLDEIDASDENLLVLINAALANGHFTLPQRFENPTVKRHPDFVCIAAANTLGLGESMVYTGRNVLDGATLDRFRAGVVEVDYSEEVESRLVDPEVLLWGRTIRRVIREHGFNRIMSTRVMLDFTKQKQELGYGPEKWNESYFADWTEDEFQAVNHARIMA